jgi:hypothetical protein
MDIPRLGLDVPAVRHDEVNLRSAGDVVERVLALRSAPLGVARDPSERVVGLCYHVALLTCALLRHAGVPARVRFGFVPYIKPGWYEDHCICEVLLGGRWRRFDPGQGLDDADDLADTFVPAGEAWLGCRSGELDPGRFGAQDPFEAADWRGWWYLRDQVVRDVAALCKVEMHPCDRWGLMSAPEDEHAADVDEMARLTGEPADWQERNTRFDRDPAYHPGASVETFDGVGGGLEERVLRLDRR